MVKTFRELTDDDQLTAVAFKIREAGDFSTAINEGFGLKREIDQEELTIARNAAALVHIMFSDELEQLEEVLRRAGGEPDLAPLVQLFLIMAQYWARHELIRRHDAGYEARVSAHGGHLIDMVHDGNGPEGRNWYLNCACQQDEEPAYRLTRDEALADMTAHMFEYGLPQSAIDHVQTEEEVLG